MGAKNINMNQKKKGLGKKNVEYMKKWKIEEKWPECNQYLK